MIKTEALRRRERRQALLTVVFTIISVIYLMPVLLVLINSLKANAFVNTETFKLPTAESFVGLKNYVKGMTFGNFAFYKVVFYADPAVHVHGGVVHLPGGEPGQQDRVLPVRILHGGALPDGHVHPGPDGGPGASEHPLDHPRDIPGLRRGPCRVYVHGLCQVHSAFH